MIGSALTAMVMHGFKALRYCVGFTSKTVAVDEFSWAYIERSGRDEYTTEPVVFLHGFSSVKESWIHIARGIDKRYKVVIPDLPGQGRTKPATTNMEYNIQLQARRLRAFLKTLFPNERKVHVVGCSMGGMLAGVYAGMYPDHVRSLTLVCPAGITMPHQSEAYRMLEETGRNPLLARTTEEIIMMNDMLSYKAKRVPRAIAAVYAKEREKHLPVYAKIINDCLSDPSVLDRFLSRIRARTLVMWGKNDRILDISSLKVLEKSLVNVPVRHIIRIDECGHTVHHEKPIECTAAINALLAGGVPSFPSSPTTPRESFNDF